MTEKAEKMLQRQARIESEIEDNPFITDEELAALLKVSIHTIRSDRRKAGIPEVRKRTKKVAETIFGESKTLSAQEIVGDLLEIDPDNSGLSLLDTTPEMGIEKSGIIRGHIIFAQANSLANAIVDADVALTGEATVKFLAPVRSGERILAKARVIKEKGRKKEIEVIMKTKKSLVFKGTFTIYCLNHELASHLNILKEVDEGCIK